MKSVDKIHLYTPKKRTPTWDYVHFLNNHAEKNGFVVRLASVDNRLALFLHRGPHRGPTEWAVLVEASTYTVLPIDATLDDLRTAIVMMVMKGE